MADFKVSENVMAIGTRYKDSYGKKIYVGDLLSVCEDIHDNCSGGTLDYEGIVEIRDGVAVCTYYDIGEEYPEPISRFPIAGREVLGEEARHRYWKTAFFGEEPPEYLWKEDLYKAHFANTERGADNG